MPPKLVVKPEDRVAAAIRLNSTLRHGSTGAVSVSAATLASQLSRSGELNGTVSLPQNDHPGVIYPVAPDLNARLARASAQWPDPKSNLVKVSDALRATAPEPITALLGVTSTTVPPPTILILEKTEKPNGRMQVTAQVDEFDGLSLVMVDVDLPGSHNKTWTRTQDWAGQPSPRSVTTWLTRPVSAGDWQIRVTANGIGGQQTVQTAHFTAVGPDSPAVAPAPTPAYDARTIAYAAANNIPPDAADKTLSAVEAISAGSWDVTWYGSVEVVLSPDGCKAVAALCSLVGSYSVSQLIAAVSSGPWYVVLIWGLILAQTVEIGGVLGSCASRGKNGKLCFNALVGLFYATEA